MKEFVFEVVIHEDDHEFWRSISGHTGCSDIYDILVNIITKEGLNNTVRLLRFEDKCECDTALYEHKK